MPLAREELLARHQEYVADEGRVRSRLAELEREQRDLTQGLERTIGARLDVEYWLAQLEQEPPPGQEYDLDDVRVIGSDDS